MLPHQTTTLRFQDQKTTALRSHDHETATFRFGDKKLRYGEKGTMNLGHRNARNFLRGAQNRDIQIPRLKSHFKIPRAKSHNIEFLRNSNSYACDIFDSFLNTHLETYKFFASVKSFPGANFVFGLTLLIFRNSTLQSRGKQPLVFNRQKHVQT